MQNKPYKLLLWTAILLLVMGLFAFNLPIDILLGDMNFVFPLVDYIYVAPIILIVFWLLYKATRNVLYSNRLTWTHIILTIATSLFIFALPFILTNSYYGHAGKLRHYYDYGRFSRFIVFGDFAFIVITVFLVAAVGLLIYFVILLLGMHKRTSGQNNG